ncbi:hypothetical protein [Streptomyces virginiae]
MPWVRLDDRFPSHRKVALLSDRAFRLHVSALCWSSENLTEGKILDTELRVIAHVRNTKAAAKELEERNLWDRVDDGWVIHDFLEYNPDRAKVKAERDANAARQQAWRDRKKAKAEAEAAAAKAREEAERNASRNGVTNGVNNATPAPAPSPSTSFGSTAAAASDPEVRTYDTLGDLKRAIADAGISGVTWNLQASQIERVRQVRERVGIPAMVAMAVGNASYRGTPSRASAWIPDWEGLEPDSQNTPGVTRLPVVRQPASPQAARRNASRDFLDRLSNELAAGENP